MVARLLAHQDAFAVVLQAFAVHLARHFVGAVEGGLDRSELRDQIARALVADAGRARECCRRRRL